MKKQLAFFLARSQIPIAWVHCSDPESWTPPEDEQQDESEMQSEETAPPTLEDDVLECLGNLKLTEHFKRFGKQLDVSEPKSLEDIYKTHLETGREYPQTGNLASSKPDLTLDLIQVPLPRSTLRERTWPGPLSTPLSTLVTVTTS